MPIVADQEGLSHARHISLKQTRVEKASMVNAEKMEGISKHPILLSGSSTLFNPWQLQFKVLRWQVLEKIFAQKCGELLTAKADNSETYSPIV